MDRCHPMTTFQEFIRLIIHPQSKTLRITDVKQFVHSLTSMKGQKLESKLGVLFPLHKNTSNTKTYIVSCCFGARTIRAAECGINQIEGDWGLTLEIMYS